VVMLARAPDRLIDPAKTLGEGMMKMRRLSGRELAAALTAAGCGKDSMQPASRRDAGAWTLWFSVIRPRVGDGDHARGRLEPQGDGTGWRWPGAVR